ncbi:MAG TPA: hypothetical protein VGB25_10320, partial [Candidatus Binatia bacterium]
TVGGAQAQASTPYFGPAEIEAYVREHANEIGREMFPDNAEVKWTVRGFTHGSKVVLAEFEPDSEEVGYPSFKFGFIGGNSKTPNHVATYCLEEGVYTLLSTGRGAPSGLPRVLE